MRNSFVAFAVLFLFTALFISDASAFGPRDQGSQDSESIRDPFPHKSKLKIDNKRIKSRTGVTTTTGGAKATRKLPASSSAKSTNQGSPKSSGSNGGVSGNVSGGPKLKIP